MTIHWRHPSQFGCIKRGKPPRPWVQVKLHCTALHSTALFVLLASSAATCIPLTCNTSSNRCEHCRTVKRKQACPTVPPIARSCSAYRQSVGGPIQRHHHQIAYPKTSAPHNSLTSSPSSPSTPCQPCIGYSHSLRRRRRQSNSASAPTLSGFLLSATTLGTCTPALHYSSSRLQQ